MDRHQIFMGGASNGDTRYIIRFFDSANFAGSQRSKFNFLVFELCDLQNQVKSNTCTTGDVTSLDTPTVKVW